ncbi:MAG: hypothetical protein IKP37_03785 [Paludibacteraceae bacterium]|nr:hypothetical protein [Paludibacteraceae bacterium]
MKSGAKLHKNNITGICFSPLLSAQKNGLFCVALPAGVALRQLQRVRFFEKSVLENSRFTAFYGSVAPTRKSRHALH